MRLSMRLSPERQALSAAARTLVAAFGLIALLASGGAGGAVAGETTGARPGSEAADGRAANGTGAIRVRFPKQEARIFFSPEKVLLVAATPGRPAWAWEISLSRYGGPDGLRASEYPLLMTGEDGAAYLRGPIIERFRIGPGWLEHRLEIRRSEVPSPLRFEFAVSGSLTPKVSEDGRLVAFHDASGAAVLKYSDLRGTDAEGRELEARWERIEPAAGSESLLRLLLQGADHLFPLQLQARLDTLVEPSTSAALSPVTSPRTGTAAGPLAAPSNDLCAGAEVIPGDGPFPVFSSTVDLTDATTGGDPPTPSCQSNISGSVWFAFTPATSGDYSLSVCADAPTATTVEDTVLAIYSSTSACAGLAELAGGCDDDACGPTGLQSSIGTIALTGGMTYDIVAWSYGAGAPPPGATSLQLRVDRLVPPGPAPANDRCEGAESIPGDGPFPYLTPVTADISGATTTGDPPVPSCQPSVSRSIWYSFAPTESGRYTFSLCTDGPTGTTVKDTVLAVYTSAVACSGFVELPAGCDDDSCVSGAAQSSLAGIGLTAGTRYDIVVWQYGSAAPAPGSSAVQMRVSRGAAPPNDRCVDATSLLPSVPVTGSTVAALDDTRLPSGTGCFAGIGQSPSIAGGSDVAYRFVAPEAGRYSFRVGGYDTAGNVVLYVASDCPVGAPPALVSGCLGAANRSTAYPEEVSCLPLAAGQTVYVYVDEHATTSGSPFTLEANRCTPESEPDGTPDSAGETACGVEGSIAPAGDADFYSLGIPVSGSRVFALVDGAAANSTDFDLRVTTGADTLEYDDFNNDLPFGSASPNVSGTRLTGTPSYLRVSHYSPAAQAEPYRLYASIQPSSSRATPEVEPNDILASAGSGVNDYYAGALSGTTDVDLFSFSAANGELLQIGLDLDPGRDNTSFNGSLALLDATGATLVLVNDPSFASSNAAGAGSLTASTPYSPGEALVYRVRVTGSYYAKVAWSSGTPGDYLLSIAHNCRVAPPADGDGDGVSDAADCAPADPAAWAVPGDAAGLVFAAGSSLLQWSAPAAPGGTSVRYDLLRSPSAASFQSPTCLAADTTATSASDSTAPGVIFYYLVRSENVCGANLGTRSDGTPRAAGSCP
jgi:hypothetical protein